MSVDVHGTILLGYVLQALAAVGLAALLRRFFRVYGHGYLRLWSWSWVAFCVFFLGTAAAVLMAAMLPENPAARWSVALVALAAGYFQIVFLVSGAYELGRQRPVGPQVLRLALAASLVLALGLGLASLPVGLEARAVLVSGIRSLVAALAFLFAAWVVIRMPRMPRQKDILGRRLVSVAFALYGLAQGVGGVSAWLAGRRLEPQMVSVYFGHIDFALQALMGFGMVVWLLEDERRRVVHAAEQIEALAYRDPVTDLPNRNLFLDELRRLLAQSKRAGERGAVLFLDLDRFKTVNDALGHAFGDQVLRAVGARLHGELRSEDCLARFGGDEFAVFLPGIRHPGEVAMVCRRLLQAAAQPLTVQGREVFTAVSIGAALYPEHGDDPETLLKRADLAMYEAKAQGRDRFEFYDAALGLKAQEVSLETDLRRALAAGEFVLVYQPVVELATGRAVAVESLLRWDHPKHGIKTPDTFLPAAEASGLVDRLDAFALRAAAEQALRWRRAGLPIRVAVNISAGQLHRFGLVRQVQEVLVATGLPAASLVIEITETAAMRDADATQVVLNSLRDLGVGIAMDDFGTGYSSLAQLHQLPIDQVKIDVSFVRGLGRDPQSATITSAVIGLAHNLGLTVVAEGVETEQQMMLLRGFGCERGQGYLFGRPVQAADVPALFTNERLVPSLTPAG